MSSEYRNKLIRRAVDGNTSPNVAASPLQARALHKFFESPQCADIVYLKIIERGEWAVSGLVQPTVSSNGPATASSLGLSGMSIGLGDATLHGGLDGSGGGGTVNSTAALGKIGAFEATSSTRGPGVGDGGDKVLMKCARLLKTYLLVYYPSDLVLLALDRFCYKMQQIFEDGAHSFEYIRALVESISNSRHGAYGTSSSGMMTPTGVAPGSMTPGPSTTPTAVPHPHFNTAPSSILSGTASPVTVPQGVAANAALKGSPPPSHEEIALRAGSGPSLSSSGNGAGILNSPTLIPNFIASRVRAYHSDPLDSLLSSCIFGGHVPKALLDLFAEHSGAFGKPSSAVPSTLTSSRNLQVKLDKMATTGSQEKLVASKAHETHAIAAYLFSLPDQDLQERISTVSVSKKMEERAMYRSFRRGQPLFQYKHYTEQVKLDLSASQIDSIVAAMVQSTNHESRLLASKILIKLILDMYCNDPIEVASSSLLAILLELVHSSQPLDTKVHAFNIIFNLSVHLQMFEEVNFFGTAPGPSSSTPSHPIPSANGSPQSLGNHPPTSGTPNSNDPANILNEPTPLASASFGSLPLDGMDTNSPDDAFDPWHGQPASAKAHNVPPRVPYPLKGSTPTVHRLQNELFSIVKELLLLLVQQQENSRKIWYSGLSCLLYFMTDTGTIEREKLVGLDVRVIAAFFKNLDYINDSVWRQLVRMLVNRLYLDSYRSTRDGKKGAFIPSHDFMSQLMSLGGPAVAQQADGTPLPSSSGKDGIRFVVDLYKRSRSAEAKDNLFYVIFDYIQYCYWKMVRGPPSSSGKATQSRTSAQYITTQFSYVLDLLTRIDAPQYFVTIFKYPPPNFVNHVFGLFTHIAQNAPEPDFALILNQTDPIILKRVLKDFHSLATMLLRLASPFAENCAAALAEPAPAVLSSSLSDISALLHGKFTTDPVTQQSLAFERLNGSQWMQQLMHLMWNVKLGLVLLPRIDLPKRSDESLSTASSLKYSRPRKDSAHTSVSKKREGHKSKELESDASAPANHSKSEHSKPDAKAASASTAKDEPKDHKSEVKDHKSEVKDHKSEHKPSSDRHKSDHHHPHRDNKDAAKADSKHHHHHTIAPKITLPHVNIAAAHANSGDPGEASPVAFKGLHTRGADSHFVETVETAFNALAKSADPVVRRHYLRIVESGMYYIFGLADQGSPASKGMSSTSNSARDASPHAISSSLLLDSEQLTKKAFDLLNGAFLHLIKNGNEQSETNLQLMFDIIVEFVSLVHVPGRALPSSGTLSTSSSSSSLHHSSSRADDLAITPRKSNTPTGFERTGRKDGVGPSASSHKTPLRKTMGDYNLSDSDESTDSEGGPFGTTKKFKDQSVDPASSGAIDRLLQSGDGSGADRNMEKHGLDMIDLNNQDDSPAGLFMRGEFDVIRSLLSLIDVQILIHIFSHLPPRMNSATRPVALHFLTERCKRSGADLDAVGGVVFFKKLLSENDPLISYLASRFLIDKLQKEQPEYFNMVVNTLLAKAVDLNDEKLVSNPYLQIKAILEMSTTSRRKEHGMSPL